MIIHAKLHLIQYDASCKCTSSCYDVKHCRNLWINFQQIQKLSCNTLYLSFVWDGGESSFPEHMRLKWEVPEGELVGEDGSRFSGPKTDRAHQAKNYNYTKLKPMKTIITQDCLIHSKSVFLSKDIVSL